MAQLKHTPGPWFVADGEMDGFEGEWDVVGPDNCGIASMAGTAEAAKYPRDKEANACLIAAAPDLLAACQRLSDSDKEGDQLAYIIKDARAAIAKATGIVVPGQHAEEK